MTMTVGKHALRIISVIPNYCQKSTPEIVLKQTKIIFQYRDIEHIIVVKLMQESSFQVNRYNQLIL